MESESITNWLSYFSGSSLYVAFFGDIFVFELQVCQSEQKACEFFEICNLGIRVSDITKPSCHHN